MDKNVPRVISFEEFSKELDFTDPVDQELYLLSLNHDFQKEIESLKLKYKIKKTLLKTPKNRSYYSLGIHDLARHTCVKDEKELGDALFNIVNKTRFKNTRYSLSLINGLIFYILYGELRIMKRPREETPIPPVKIEIKRRTKLGVKEAIRITLDLFVDTAEEEVVKAIREHWKWVRTMQKKLLQDKKFSRPAVKDTLIRDSYFLYLDILGMPTEEIMNYFPKSKLTPKEVSNRILKMRKRVHNSFTP